jgi:predicted Zn-dependent protease
MGIFVVVTSKNGRPVGIYNSGIGDHWPADHRTLTIVDRTDDPNWHQAVLSAVATWEAGGSALHFVVETESGACQQTRDHIEYCQATTTQIDKQGSDGDQGLFVPDVGNNNEYRSAILLVCSDCNIDQNRQVIIATHELGHALGLAHSPDADSVMYFSGGSTQPDARDYQILRQLEGTAVAS